MEAERIASRPAELGEHCDIKPPVPIFSNRQIGSAGASPSPQRSRRGWMGWGSDRSKDAATPSRGSPTPTDDGGVGSPSMNVYPYAKKILESPPVGGSAGGAASAKKEAKKEAKKAKGLFG